MRRTVVLPYFTVLAKDRLEEGRLGVVAVDQQGHVGSFGDVSDGRCVCHESSFARRDAGRSICEAFSRKVGSAAGVS